MKKHLLLPTLFSLTCLAMAALTVRSFTDQQTESMEENRSLAAMPDFSVDSWFSGRYAEAFNNYLNDHIALRSSFIARSQELEAVAARKMKIKVTGATASNSSAETNAPFETDKDTVISSQAAEAVTEQEATAASRKSISSTGEEEDILGDDVAILEDRIVNLYIHDEEIIQRYAEVSDLFFSMFPDYVTKVEVLIPSRCQYEETDIKALCDDEIADIDEIMSKIDPLIYKADVDAQMQPYIDDLDQLYYRTDHHWTHFGAYLGAKAISEVTGSQMVTLNDYQENTGDDFLGYLYAKHPDETVAKHKDKLSYYTPKDHEILKGIKYMYSEYGELEESEELILDPDREGYYSFGARSFARLDIDGRKQDGHKILLVGDSYCNSLLTWLAEDASKLVVLDPRDYKEGREGVLKLYEEYEFDEVILAFHMGVLSTPYFAGTIRRLTE